MVSLKFHKDENSETETLPPPEGGTGTVSETPKKRGRPKGSTNKATLAKLEEQLEGKILEELLIPIVFISPLAAANIEARAKRTSQALARLASKNPKVKKILETALEGSDVFTVALFFGSTMICIMVDLSMMDKDSIVSRAMGVPGYYSELYPNEDEENLDKNGNGGRGIYAEL